MVGADHHSAAALCDPFQDIEQRAMLEPAFGDAAVRGFVLGQFTDHLHLGARMAQHVHKIVDDGVEAIAHQVVQRIGQFAASSEVRDLVVTELDVLSQPLQLIAEEFFLVRVLAALLLLTDPLSRETLFDLARHYTGEERVACVLRCCGQDAEEHVLLLGAVVLVEDGLQNAPLVQTQVIDEHHEERLAVLEVRRDFRAEELVALQRDVLTLAVHPIHVTIAHVAAEHVVRFLPLAAQDLGHAGVLTALQFKFPSDQVAVQFFPFLHRQPVADAHAQLPELPLVIGVRFLAHQPPSIDMLLEGEQDLVRVHGLDQVIADLAADRILHDVFLLALGDHHHGRLRGKGFDLGERFETGEAGHVLIEQYGAVLLPLHLLHRVDAVVHGIHGVAFLLQEQYVWAQEIDLVVGPQDGNTHSGCKGVREKQERTNGGSGLRGGEGRGHGSLCAITRSGIQKKRGAR